MAFIAYSISVLVFVEIFLILLMLAPYVNRVTAPLVAKVLSLVRTPLYVIMVGLAVATADAARDMWKYSEKVVESAAKQTVAALSERNEYQRYKFHAERNFYIYAFALTLFFIIVRLETVLTNYREMKAKLAGFEAAAVKGNQAKKNE